MWDGSWRESDRVLDMAGHVSLDRSSGRAASSHLGHRTPLAYLACRYATDGRWLTCIDICSDRGVNMQSSAEAGASRDTGATRKRVLTEDRKKQNREAQRRFRMPEH